MKIKTEYGIREYTKRTFNSKEQFLNSINGIDEVTDDENYVIEFEDGKKQECLHFYYSVDGELIKGSVIECFYYDNVFLTIFFKHIY